MAGRAKPWIGLALLVCACGSTLDANGDSAASKADAAPPDPREDGGDGTAGDDSASGAGGNAGEPPDAGREPEASGGAGSAAPTDAGGPGPCAVANCDPEEGSCAVEQDVPVCSCQPGYRDRQGDGSSCEDIDECGSGVPRCAANATCVNTPASFACLCDAGFHGDGVTSCAPNTACTVEQSDAVCGIHAGCVTRGDEGRCWCSTGFEGSGLDCTDRDECARGVDDCHPLAHCENREGNYACGCPDGYIGDGHGGAGCFLPRSRLSEPRIPAISGECPAFVPGTSTIPRLLGLKLQVGAKPEQPTGALLFYWHATGSDAVEAETMLPAAMRQEILNGGGIIAAFEMSLGSGGDCSGTGVFARGDFETADLIAACAVRDHNVDPRRIYVTGCSAGGFQAGCMAIARSGYVAAVATNSGGVVQRMSLQAPHAPAAITMYGGEGGPLFIDSAMTSKALSEQLSAHGGFAVACNHGGGHCGAPAELHVAAWRFMKAHPFGIVESPFTDGLPPDFPTYCSVQPPSMARAR